MQEVRSYQNNEVESKIAGSANKPTQTHKVMVHCLETSNTAAGRPPVLSLAELAGAQEKR